MDSKQNRERMESGKLYFPADEAVMAEQTACMERLWEYNHTRPSEGEKRARMLEELFAHVGKNAYIEPPLRANWGGARVRLGDNFYANFNLTLVEATPSCPSCAASYCNTTFPCASGTTCGSARGPFSCPA